MDKKHIIAITDLSKGMQLPLIAARQDLSSAAKDGIEYLYNRGKILVSFEDNVERRQLQLQEKFHEMHLAAIENMVRHVQEVRESSWTDSPHYKHLGIRGPTLIVSKMFMAIRLGFVKPNSLRDFISSLTWDWASSRLAGKFTAFFNTAMSVAIEDHVRETLPHWYTKIPLLNPKRYALGVQSYTFDIEAGLYRVNKGLSIQKTSDGYFDINYTTDFGGI